MYLTTNVLAGDAETVLLVKGSDTKIIFRNCTFTSVRLRVFDEAVLECHSCIFTATEDTFVTASTAQATLKGCHFYNSEKAIAACAAAHARMEVHDCTITRLLLGAAAYEGSRLIVRHTNIKHCQRRGIWVHGPGPCAVIENTAISRCCGSALMISDGAHAGIFASSMTDSIDAGHDIPAEYTFSYAGCRHTVPGFHQGHGLIVAGSGTHVKLESCRLTDNASAGVYLCRADVSMEGGSIQQGSGSYAVVCAQPASTSKLQAQGTEFEGSWLTHAAHSQCQFPSGSHPGLEVQLDECPKECKQSE